MISDLGWQEILNRNQKDHERQQEQEMYEHEKQLQLRGKLTEADIKRYYNMLLVLTQIQKTFFCCKQML